MSHVASPPRTRSRSVHPLARIGQLFATWAGFGLMVLMLWLGQSGSSEARLNPYYVVRGAAFGTVSPRILFVLDTSSSMALRAASGNSRCDWGDCENPAVAGTSQESRMAASRRAIREVIDGASETAEFSLMTFVQNVPETQDPPPTCTYGGGPVRFARINEYDDYYDGWAAIENGLGYEGALRLCQGAARRPYAYIRWDELGNVPSIAANDQTGEVPPSPLISRAESDYMTVANMQRRVQFFPEFRGVRMQLSNSAEDTAFRDLSVGDYDRASEVLNQDFYYWPYVDGFSGYGAHWTRERIAGVTVPYGGGSISAGTSDYEDYVPGATLHAPFYVDLTTVSTPDDWGPASGDESLQTALGRTAPLIEGGVDAVGGTPWRDAIGLTSAPFPDDNRGGSHASVASYLNYLGSVDVSACSPTSVVLLTDGEPTPSSQGGSQLYQRLAALRNELGADVYVVGFFLGGGGELNDMACAAAGACVGSCTSPCGDDPADEWDTCADPSDPENGCAYTADSSAALQAALADIIDDALSVDISSGQGAVINEFGASGLADGVVAVQTVFSASTDYPGWTGHVERRYCEVYDELDVLVPTCVEPSPQFAPEVEAAFDTFGPCPMGRDWDAADCLQAMPWASRRIYSHDANNVVYPISYSDGTAHDDFIAELTTLDLVSGVDSEADADEIVAFLLGRDREAMDLSKLPGISSSSPITVRRVPEYDGERLPEVPIIDPHCAGRRFGELDAGTLPDSLEEFAQTAWDEDEAPNYTYQEAVVVGDDFGIIHAFQLDSGNELFGLIPRFALKNAVEQAANGPGNMGQPTEDLEDHIFGVSSTLNHGWAFDSDASRWRHLGIIGMGAGGTEYIALDLSHMNPGADPPIDVLWTTGDTALAADYEPLLGETWARPALTYHASNDQIGSEPETFLVAGSGYPEEDDIAAEGRALFVANAMTGELLDSAELPPIGDVYESAFGSVVDPSVGSHCISRYWAEAQEAYVADPAGRLFRWDLGRDTTPLTFKHDADSGVGDWGAGGVAVPLAYFPACTSTGDNCSVNAGNPGDPFAFGPAVTAFNRIDDAGGGALDEVEENNQFLIALVSGSPNDSTIDGGDADNDFHSSLYLLADDHSGAGDGVSVPAGAPTSGGAFSAGDSISGNPGYMRIAVSDITRTRRVTPFPGAAEFTETRDFSKAARPVRAPRIYVTGVVDGGGGTPVVVDDVEVYYVTYYIYEPGSGECDPRFYDPGERTWHADRGTTYEITFRLTADTSTGFEFNSGASGGGALADFGPAFDTGLQLAAVEQVGGSECEGGNCGATVTPEAFVPCNNNPPEGEGLPTSTYVVPMGSKTLDAFSPVEN